MEDVPRGRHAGIARRRWVLRCAAAALMVAWGLGSCVPGLEGARDAANGGPGLLVAHQLELRALTGASASGSLSLRNPTWLARTAVLRSTDPFLSVSSGRLTLPPDAERDVALTARCGDTPAVHRGWVVVDSDHGSEAFGVRLVCGGDDLGQVAAVAGAAPGPRGLLGHGGPLSWEPPQLEAPQVVRVVDDGGPSEIALAPDRDYLLLLPDEPLRRGFTIRGGRNVVLIGGEIDIPHQGPDASVGRRRALHIVDATGTVHVEGLLMHGEDITEGIQIAAPEAVVQIQNVGVFGIRARDQVRFSDNHPDLIQSYGNAREIRVDRFSGSTDYQGFFFVADYHGPAHGPVVLRRVHIVGEPTARYLLWFSVHPQAGDVQLEDVWLEVPPERSGGLGRSVWPDVEGDAGVAARQAEAERGEVAVRWPATMRPLVQGVVRGGAPPGGTFVRREDVGVGYASPGYELRD